MIPTYPFTVTIDYKPEVHRKPVAKSFETMASAMAALIENQGKRDVKRIRVTLIIEQVENNNHPKK